MVSQKIIFQRGLDATVSPQGFQDVSIISEGPALGHGLHVDQKSVTGLAQILSGQTLKAYLTHAGALGGVDRLGQEIGYFTGFKQVGQKLKAGFTFLRSFMTHEQPVYDRLVEMADVMPESFGLSVVFSGSQVWVKADGTEVDGELARPANALRDVPSIRFSEVESADFVSSPAAQGGGGLFSAPTGTITYSKHLSALADVKTGLGELAALRSTVAALNADRDELRKKLKEAEGFDLRLCGGPPIRLDYNSSLEDSYPAPDAGSGDQGWWQEFSRIQQRSGKSAADAWALRNKKPSAK